MQNPFDLDNQTAYLHWRTVAMPEELLAANLPHIHYARLENGMGPLCNNVLHDRADFSNAPEYPRLLYRARYYDRIAGS